MVERKLKGPQPLNTEAFPTGATAGGIGVGELEAPGNQLVGVIELSPLQIQRAFAVHKDLHTRRRNQYVALLGAIHKSQAIGQAVAAAACYANP